MTKSTYLMIPSWVHDYWHGISLLCALSLVSCAKKPQDSRSTKDSSWSNLTWVKIPTHTGQDSIPITIIRAAQPTIPLGIKAMLDSAYPGWVYVSHQDVKAPARPGERTERFEVYPCDLNGDSVTDYAMAVVAGKDSARAECFLAFTAKGSTFQLFRLAEFKASLGIVGGSELRLQRKGEGIPDFSKWKDTENDEAEMDSIITIFKTDALTLMPLNGCCPSTFIFENGRFREFDSGD